MYNVLNYCFFFQGEPGIQGEPGTVGPMGKKVK